MNWLNPIKDNPKLTICKFYNSGRGHPFEQGCQSLGFWMEQEPELAGNGAGNVTNGRLR